MKRKTQHKHQTRRNWARNNLNLLLEITCHYLCAPRKNDFKTVGEFASMMQKHHRVQIPVDRVSAKTSKTKSTLKRKKEPHKEPKHPSPPKKQCTEEPSYLTQNENKTGTDPTAVQKRNNTTGPKISSCHDDNKNEETNPCMLPV